ncbi:MAG TPA: DUF4082 domain-containing protein [Thermoleophilaceae bacterium]|nr:DUF4082 domain-containing protein [Thermoleophilaceae bacterium]
MRAFRPLLATAALTLALAGAPAAEAQSPTCPCTVFAPTAAPLGDAVQDQPVEVGMKFRSDEDGFITELRFYKQANNTGTHVGHLWSDTGQLLAEAEFTGETASGWQQTTLPTPIAIARDTTYVVSYHSSQGRFAFSSGYFFSGVDNPPLHAPADAAAGGNGVFRYGPSSSFPDSTFNATNYWVDAVFDRVQPADTRPPLVSAVSPAAGAAGMPATTEVTATFDEPMNSVSVTDGGFSLSDEEGDPVPAEVAYDAQTRTATLTPDGDLAPGTSYTARVEGGSGGVVDLAGNELAADHTWTFSTATDCPCTVFAPGDGPTGDAVSDQPVEVGMKFRSDEDGFITELRFYKQANNTGTHVGHLWSGTGQLLAQATYTGETASGWQEVELPNAVPIERDTVYVTSYHAAGGRFAFSPGYFAQSVDRAPLHAPRDAVVGGNGVFRYGASAFPDQTFNATNYWVDATFERTAPPDVRGPTITDLSPDAGASDVPRDTEVSAGFDEPLAPASVSGATFTLRDETGNAVPSDVSYDAQTRVATLTPQAQLAYATTYTARLEGGAGGIADLAGNALADDRTWSFTVASQSPAEGPGGPIQVITDPGDPFGRYYAEILRAEGLNEFDVTSGPVTAQALSGHDVVLLASPAVTDAEAALLTDWVQAGGNLVAMRPDKRLAGLLGLTDAGGTRTNQYMRVDTGTAAGAGIEGQTLQFHGTADRYTLSGASAVARLYSDAATATSDPAVSLRSVGGSGGEAAAFTYDLARSVVYTRQGNPAWAGQKRDGTPNGIRANDLFYPDWVDMSKIAVPQADEQQRLLVNLITEMNRDKAPLPRFWYLPRGDKAAVVMTGDDHGINGTPSYFDRFKSSSPAGCSVADWECVRASSYLYPGTAMTDAQAAAYEAEGFEVALHLTTGCADFTSASLDAALTSQPSQFAASWPSVRKPVSNRTHCIVWSDWATEPRVEKAHGIRFDTNYYYLGPPGWLTQPGLLTGSGFPQRFADLDGSMIDVYQAMTQVTDESDMPMAPQVDTLLDNALGDRAWYGVITVNAHTDYGDQANANNIVASAQERGVPVVSSAQMLDWLDGRNGSSFENIAYNGGQLSFSVEPSAKARGLEAMLPAHSASGTLTHLTRAGQSVARSTRTVKGVNYVVFKATAGDYVATYATDTSPPEIAGLAAVADGEGHATVTWDTDEAATSRVEYGPTTALGSEVSDSARVTEHSMELTGLTPGTTYRFRVISVDAAGNSASAPPTAQAPASFETQPGSLVDNRTYEFAAGDVSGTHVGATLAGVDGEVQLEPTVGEEFEGPVLPAGWDTRSWGLGGEAISSGDSLVADGAAAYTTSFFEPQRVLEFTASFRPVNDQAVGFGNDLTDYPLAVFSTGSPAQPIRMYAQTGTHGSPEQLTPLPGVGFNDPHRFRIEWNPASVSYYVDGTHVATHNVAIAGPMRPVVSDFGPFGAGVEVHWLRQGAYDATGTFTSRVLDAGGASEWQALAAQSTLPSGTQLAFDTRSGSTPQPGAGWSSWQPVGGGGAIASPVSRYLQYRAHATSSTGLRSPTLDRVSIGFVAGTFDADPPSAPGSLSANGQLGAAALSWGQSSDNVGVIEYRVHRSTTTGFTPSAANLVATVTQGTSYTDTGLSAGTYYYRVVAADAAGNASDPSNQASAAVTTDTTPPNVSISTPAAGASVSGTTTVTAFASDNIGVESVQFMVDGASVGSADTSSPYSLSWDTTGLSNGTHTLSAVARDAAGNTRTAANVSVTVDNSAPNVAITAPAPGATLSGTATVTASASDNVGVESVQFMVDGFTVWTDTTSPYSLSGSTTWLSDGTHTLSAVARDAAGNATTSADVTVTVDNNAPTVSITSPTAGTTVSGNRTLTASASDAVGVQSVQFQVDGADIGAADTTSPYSVSWDSNGVTDGDHVLTAVARDAAGFTRTSANVAVTVDNDGLIAAYGFEETSGSTVTDLARDHNGTISGAGRTSSGRFGRALTFDGNNDWVTVPHDSELNLSSGLTVEAWVRPGSLGSRTWRTVVTKERSSSLSWGLFANNNVARPAARLFAGSDLWTSGTAQLPLSTWSHLTMTWNNATLRLYLNGNQVSSRSATSPLSTGTSPLRIGGRQSQSQWFNGRIDEIRLYRRALSASEIVADMNRAVP